MENNIQQFIEKAISLSQDAVNVGGYPVGAVVVMDGEIVAEGLSDGKNAYDATLHAETDAIRKASQKLYKRDLHGAVIYSSMEPCLMCLSACTWAKIDSIYFAISRQQLPQVCFEGWHDIDVIAQDFYKKIQIEHLADYEEDALAIYKKWEDSLKS